MRAEDVDYVELIGGGSRIPKLQSMIQEILEDKTGKVGTHINGDEAAANGDIGGIRAALIDGATDLNKALFLFCLFADS